MLERTLSFIAWRNFFDPLVLLYWALGLLHLGVFVWVALVTGRMVAAERRFDRASEEFPILLAAGFGVWAVLLFVLGIAGFYRLPIIAAVALGCMAWAPLRKRSLRVLLDPGRLVVVAIREAPLLWVVFLLFSMASLLPPYRWDEMSYHLAYPQQWIAAGRITTDPFMRYPLYTNNWPLLTGVALMLGGSALAHLLSWVAGVATALVIDGLLARAEVMRPLRGLAAAAFLFTPLVQRYLNVAHVDLGLFFFFAVTTYAMIELTREPKSRARAAALAALCGGMFLGMKVLNVVFAPLFLGFAWYRLRWSRELAVFLVVGALVGLPWYVRNLVLGGDPAPPLVSRVLGLPNADWSPEDQAAIEEDLERGLSWAPEALVRIPITALLSTEQGPLRDWPVLGWMLLLPLTVFTFGRLYRLGAPELLIALWYAIAIWIATTYLLRYAIFLPLAIVCATVLLDSLARQLGGSRARLVGTLLGMVLLIGPTASALQYAKHAFSVRIPTTPSARAKFARKRNPQLAITEPLRHVAPDSARIYSLGYTMLKYYLQPYGWHIVGDDFHRGRYADFFSALRAGRHDVFFQELEVDVVALDRAELARRFGGSLADAERQLEASSALRLAYRDSSHVIYRLERTPQPVR